MVKVTALIARLLHALVFLVASVTELADRTGSLQVLKDFGVLAPLATPLKSLLQLAELAMAASLIPFGAPETGPA